MNISSLILETLDKEKKKKLKRLALAAGAAALGGAYIKHSNNNYHKLMDKIGSATLGGINIAAHAGHRALKPMMIDNDDNKKRILTKAGVGGAEGLGHHIVNRIIAHGVANAVHGRENFFNAGKKAQLRNLVTGGLTLHNTVKNAKEHLDAYHYMT